MPSMRYMKSSNKTSLISKLALSSRTSLGEPHSPKYPSLLVGPPSVMISTPNHLTTDLCRTKAIECLNLAQQAASNSHRIMLKHIAETWYRIADGLPANDA
jgi:hypothetical protein